MGDGYITVSTTVVVGLRILQRGVRKLKEKSAVLTLAQGGRESNWKTKET